MSDDNGNVSWTQAIPVRNGFILSFSHDCLGLLTAAEAYTSLGYGVIPLLGDRDPSRPKVPAVPWSAFQQRQAQPDELRQWFLHDGLAGLGILTGRISHLIILDFDSQTIFDDFRSQFPDLVATRTVLSAGRQLPHLYFRLPDHLHLPSQMGQGIDLLADGRYVVAPPTTIAGQAYTLIRGGIPRTLTERDGRRLLAFLNTHKPQQPKYQPEPPAASPTAIAAPKASLHDLQALYRHWCKQGGRNEALFRTALYARDSGWLEAQTEQCLVELHVHQPSASCDESDDQRRHEACATLRSAFSRPPRHDQRPGHRNSHQLSNNVREALLQRKQTYVVRTLEGLYKSSFQPGQVFTTDQALQALKGLVGRDSVYNALNTTADSEKHLFERVSPPHTPPQDSNAVAGHSNESNNKKCFFVIEQKPGINRRGPKNRLFRLPHNLDLCRLLGVPASGSDILHREDLSGARQTRMALHRELIKRRPGAYSRRWLARRLGVSRRTIDTYNRLIPIHSRDVYLDSSLNWSTIERLPLDEALPGAFIETVSGKRYPAQRSIAARLLAKGHLLRLKERTLNLYWYGDIEPSEYAGYERQMVHQVALEASTRQLLAQPPSVRVSSTGQSGRTVPAKTQTVQSIPEPLPPDQQKALAQQVYLIVNQLGAEKTKCLSLANAHRLVASYSEEAIHTALNILQQRRVTNPAGFLVTTLRSNSRSYSYPTT